MGSTAAGRDTLAQDEENIITSVRSTLDSSAGKVSERTDGGGCCKTEVHR